MLYCQNALLGGVLTCVSLSIHIPFWSKKDTVTIPPKSPGYIAMLLQSRTLGKKKNTIKRDWFEMGTARDKAEKSSHTCKGRMGNTGLRET